MATKHVLTPFKSDQNITVLTVSISSLTSFSRKSIEGDAVYIWKLIQYS